MIIELAQANNESAIIQSMNLNDFVHLPWDTAPNYWMMGMEHRFMVIRDDLAVVHTTAHPGTGVPPHIHHREDETFYVLSGRGIATFNGEEVDLLPGTILFLPRGIEHSFACAGDEPLAMLVVITPGHFAKAFLEFGTLMDADFVAPPLGPPPPGMLEKFVTDYGLEFLPPAQS